MQAIVAGLESKLSAAWARSAAFFLHSDGAGLPLARGVFDEGRPKSAQLERKHGSELDCCAAIDTF
jgi:hypothetical protein